MNVPPMKDFFAHESCYLDEGCEIGAGTKIWHFTHVMAGARIGRSCNIGQNVVISPEVVIGDNARIQNNVSVYTGVVLEDDVFCGPSMVFTNVVNPRSQVSRKHEFRQTLVRYDVALLGNLTEKLLVYALGRGLEPSDMPSVRRILREAAPQQHRWLALAIAIAKSQPATEPPR